MGYVMKRLILAVMVMCMGAGVQAGLVITKAGKVSFGIVVAKKDAIVVGIKIGNAVGKVSYKKAVVFWYTTHNKVRNHYQGAVYAYKKKAYKASRFLAKAAMRKEPKNKVKASELLRFIESLQKIEDPIAKAQESKRASLEE